MMRSIGTGLAWLVLALSASLSPLSAGEKDYEYQVRFEPKNPDVGDSYRMYVQVWNNNPKYPMVFRASIVKLPEGDRLLGARDMEKKVAAKGTHTFRFDIFCGSDTGSVTYNVTAGWE